MGVEAAFVGVGSDKWGDQMNRADQAQALEEEAQHPAARATDVLQHHRDHRSPLRSGHDPGREARHQEPAETRATLLATSLEQAVGREFLNSEMASVSEHCLQVIEESEDLLYIVFTRADTGFSMVFFDDPSVTRKWRDATLTGIWNPPPGQAEVGIRNTSLTEKSVYHYTHSGARSGYAWGYVHVGLALDNYNESVRMVYAGTGVVSGVTMLVGALIAFFFARNLTKPLQSLQLFAHKVAAGAVTERAQISTNDEIEDLADSINTMVESLENSQLKIKESMVQEVALREKEILLREIHHRVKNNMQILSSLLRLQARQADSEQLKDILSESEARIRSMGLLHEKLYQSDSVSEIEWKATSGRSQTRSCG